MLFTIINSFSLLFKISIADITLFCNLLLIIVINVIDFWFIIFLYFHTSTHMGNYLCFFTYYHLIIMSLRCTCSICIIHIGIILEFHYLTTVKTVCVFMLIIDSFDRFQTISIISSAHFHTFGCALVPFIKVLWCSELWLLGLVW